MTPLAAMVTAGSLSGLALFLLVWALVPAPPALGPALRRLNPTTPPATYAVPVGWLRRRLRVPHSDLRLLGRTPERYLVTLGLAAFFALLLPALLTAVVLVAGLPVSPLIPTAGAVLAAAGAVLLAHREVRTRAAAARAEFTRAVCTYLDLTAHQVRAGRGPVESLDRAAAVCHGWVFARIRETLLRAELQLQPPWDELRLLARDIDVVELGDLADIMRTAGTQGADVHRTLRARADSMRDQLRTTALAEAEVRTSKLDIPAAALILILLVLIGYPFLARLMAGP